MTVETQVVSHSWLPGAAMLAEALTGIVFRSADEIRVTRILASGAEATCALGTDYEIGGDGASGAGWARALLVEAADTQFYAERVTPALQRNAFAPHAPLPAKAIEASLDDVVKMAQELRLADSRALRLPDRGGVSALPGSVARRGKFLFFNAETGAPEPVYAQPASQQGAIVVTDGPWSADKTGASTALPAFQAAANALGAARGGKLLVPPGVFDLTSGQLSLPLGVSLGGIAPGPFDSTLDPISTAGLAGVLLLKPGSTQSAIICPAASNTISDLLLIDPTQVDPNATAPIQRGYMVQFSGPSQFLVNCTIVKAYAGLSIQCGRSGAIGNIFGCYANDIYADNSADWLVIRSNLVSPMWNVFGGALPVGQPIDTWVLNNAVALKTGRVDGLRVSDFNVFARHTAHKAIQSPNAGLGQRYGYGTFMGGDWDTVAFGANLDGTYPGTEGFMYCGTEMSPNLTGIGTTGQAAIITNAGATAGAEPRATWESGKDRIPGSWALSPFAVKRNAGRIFVEGGVRGIRPYGGVSAPAFPASNVGITNDYPFPVRFRAVVSGGTFTNFIAAGLGLGASGTEVKDDWMPGETIAFTYTGTGSFVGGLIGK